ncbi:MAG: Ycf66 family protein [Cyanobacteriota bacterium]|nr:Ycf66 family protein [Cyanobacteriota bacterium]
MLATLAGLLALFTGLLVLLVPLMTPELSRQRDSFWGAVVLLLGLTLVTCSDRLAGAPMLAVVCAALLIGRLSVEVSQLRWRLLSVEEQQTLVSAERWQANLQQLAAALARLLAIAGELRDQLSQLLRAKGGPKTPGKRWVRAEADALNPSAAATESATLTEPADHVVVSSFSEIDALIQGSSPA